MSRKKSNTILEKMKARLDTLLAGGESPAEWIASLDRPSWDRYFMSMAFLTAMRSPDQETKQGCVIVDWPSKVPIAFGFNGHPRGIKGLPTKRPNKYPFMVHADSNAVANCMHPSSNAVVYLPMPPCEKCLGLMLNMPFVCVQRIVYYEERMFPHTLTLLKKANVCVERFQGKPPADILLTAAAYLYAREMHSDELSAGATRYYSKGKS